MKGADVAFQELQLNLIVEESIHLKWASLENWMVAPLPSLVLQIRLSVYTDEILCIVFFYTASFYFKYSFTDFINFILHFYGIYCIRLILLYWRLLFFYRYYIQCFKKCCIKSCFRRVKNKGSGTPFIFMNWKEYLYTSLIFWPLMAYLLFEFLGWKWEYSLRESWLCGLPW